MHTPGGGGVPIRPRAGAVWVRSAVPGAGIRRISADRLAEVGWGLDARRLRERINVARADAHLWFRQSSSALQPRTV